MAVTIDKIQLLYGIESDWERINPILLKGEPGVVLDNTNQIPLYLKIGNGTLRFNELPVLGAGSGLGIDTDVIYTRAEIDNLLREINTSLSTTVENSIEINSKISETATANNKLLSRIEITDLVKEYTKARYIWSNTASAQFSTIEALQAGPWYYNGRLVSSNNLRDKDISIISNNRYIFIPGSGWTFDGVNTAFTNDQILSINSGISSTRVQTIEERIALLEAAKTSLENSLATQVEALTIAQSNASNRAQQTENKMSSLAAQNNKLLSESEVRAIIQTASAGFNLSASQVAALNSGITANILEAITENLANKSDREFILYNFLATPRATGSGYKKYSRVLIAQTIPAFVTGVTSTGGITSLYIPPIGQDFTPQGLVEYPVTSEQADGSSSATCSVSRLCSRNFTNQELLMTISATILEFSKEDSLTNQAGDNFIRVLRNGLQARLNNTPNTIYVNSSYTGISEGFELAPYKSLTEALTSINTGDSTLTRATIKLAPGLYEATTVTLNNDQPIKITIEGASSSSTEIPSLVISTGHLIDLRISKLKIGTLTHLLIPNEEDLGRSTIALDSTIIYNNINTIDNKIYSINNSKITDTTVGNNSFLYLTNTNFENSTITGNTGSNIVAKESFGGRVVLASGASYIQFSTTLRPITAAGYALTANAGATLVALYSGQCLTSENRPAPISIQANVNYLLGTTIVKKKGASAGQSSISSIATRISDSQLESSQIFMGGASAEIGNTGYSTNANTLEDHIRAISVAITQLTTSTSAKYTKPTAGIPIADLENSLVNKINSAEQTSNRATTITSSTSTKYTTEGAVFNKVKEVTDWIDADIATKNYVTEAIQAGSTLRILTPVASPDPTIDGSSWWTSLEALIDTQNTKYLNGLPHDPEAGDEAIYYGTDSQIYKAKFNGTTWQPYTVFTVDLSSKQEKLQGNGGLLKLSPTAGSYTEVEIAETIPNDDSQDDNIPTVAAIKERLTSYQENLPASDILNTQQILATSDTPGQPTKINIKTSKITEESIDTDIPNATAVLETLADYQPKIATQNDDSIVISTSEGLSFKSIATTLESGNNSIPTSGAVNEAITDALAQVPTAGDISTLEDSVAAKQDKINGNEQELLLVTPLTTGGQPGTRAIATELTGGTPTINIPTAGAVSGAINSAASTFQPKISNLAGKLLVGTSTDGTIAGRTIDSENLGESSVGIPTSQAVLEAIQESRGDTVRVILTDTSNLFTAGAQTKKSYTLESNKDYHLLDESTPSKRYWINRMDELEDELGNELNDIMLESVKMSSELSLNHNWLAQFIENRENKLNISNSDMAFAVGANQTINATMTNSSLYISATGLWVEEGTSSDKSISAKLINSNLTIDSSTSYNGEILKKTVVIQQLEKGSKIYLTGATIATLATLNVGEVIQVKLDASSEIHLSGKSVLIIPQEIIESADSLPTVYRHSSNASVKADSEDDAGVTASLLASKKFRIIDLVAKIDYFTSERATRLGTGPDAPASSTQLVMGDGTAPSTIGMTEIGDITKYKPIYIEDGVPTEIPGAIENDTNGNAATATKLKDARNLKVDLANFQTSAPFDGSSDQLSIQIAGKLGISNGGTGANNAADALENLGLTVTAGTINHLSGITDNVQTQLNEKANKGLIPYDKVIRTPAEFEALIDSETWLGATSVALVGQFTLSTANNSGVNIPATVKQIHGFNSAKITITNFLYNETTAKGGLWYATTPTTKDYSIRDLEVSCTGGTVGYGFINCNNLSNCIGTGTGTTYGWGFSYCNNLSNCTGTGTETGNGETEGFGFNSCNNLSNCTGTGTGTGLATGKGASTTYGFRFCNNLSNCTGTGTGTSTAGTNGTGFYFCQNLSNCTGTGMSTYGWGFKRCDNLSNCIGTGTGTTSGYGFYNILCAVNCEDGGSKTAMWGGTNRNISVETCRKTPVEVTAAEHITLNA